MLKGDESSSEQALLLEVVGEDEGELASVHNLHALLRLSMAIPGCYITLRDCHQIPPYEPMKGLDLISSWTSCKDMGRAMRPITLFN